MCTVIANYNQYQEWITEKEGRLPAPLFRGHERDSYQLLPTISRGNISRDEIISLEQNLFKNFKEATIESELGDILIQSSGNQFLPDWHLAFQMRHLEIPSRLIDFTFNSDVALYFAVSNDKAWEENGHVWYFQSYDQRFNKVNSSFEEILNNNFIHTSAGEELQGVLSQHAPTHLDQVVLAHSLYDGIDFYRQIGNQRKFRQRGKFIAMKNEWIKYQMDEDMLNVLNEKGLNDDYLLPDISESTKKIIDDIILKSRQEANLPIK